MRPRADLGVSGEEILALIRELLPFCRSITGDGLRESLRKIAESVPLQIHEVPTGTKVLDWTIPKEWNVRDGWIKDPGGRKIVDFQDSSLHVVGYSVPVSGEFTLSDLRPHLFSIPEQPDWIPYRTSYYERTWGFCLRQRTLDSMEDGTYTVLIDSTLEEGALSYGELFLPGDSPDEVLISSHSCHPGMCNDNLSGMAVAAMLGRHLGEAPHRLSYRFLFLPGTLGAITWLARNEHNLDRVKHGLVLAGIGDRGGLTYKRSRRGNTLIDRAATHVLQGPDPAGEVRSFEPFGYDERQFCSPGFDLPVGCLMRTPWGEYPEYHTSADNMDFVDKDSLWGSFQACLEIFQILEEDGRYLNLVPKGEPMLGPRNIFRGYVSGNLGEIDRAVFWVLNLSDGRHSILDIAERSGMPFRSLSDAVSLLEAAGLVRPHNSD